MYGRELREFCFGSQGVDVMVRGILVGDYCRDRWERQTNVIGMWLSLMQHWSALAGGHDRAAAWV